MKKTREEIEQIAEVVVDAMLKGHPIDEAQLLTHLPLGSSTWLPRELERHSHQGRHQAHGQQMMSRSVVLLRASRAFAVNLASPRPRKHHVEREPHRSRRAGPTPIRHVHP